MIGQRALATLALASGALAGVLYYAGAQRSPVVVVARDVDALRPLSHGDLTVMSIPPDAVPPGALSDPGAAVGRTPRAPLWRGQVVLAEGLAIASAAFQTGLSLSDGMRAVALPVGAAQAIGGAIVPGSRVDVIAVPLVGRAPEGRMTEVLAMSALVLDVRTEAGAAHRQIAANAGLVERIGSVVVAIDAPDEIRFADRIATSTFILALTPSS